MGRLREKWTALASSLGFKIALSVGLILLGSYMFFVYLVLDIQQDFYFEQIKKEAERFSAAVINATNHSMLQDDREATRNIIRDMGKQEEISDIRIYDHAGVIKFSSQSWKSEPRSTRKLRLALSAIQRMSPSIRWLRTIGHTFTITAAIGCWE